jgi:hypothetical protein
MDQLTHTVPNVTGLHPFPLSVTQGTMEHITHMGKYKEFNVRYNESQEHSMR